MEPIPEPTIIIEHTLFNLTAVYCWCRKGVPLYAGSSRNVIARIFSGHHLILSRKPVLPGDEIMLWKFSDIRDAQDFERRVIKEWKPLYNSHGAVKTKKPSFKTLVKRECKEKTEK